MNKSNKTVHLTMTFLFLAATLILSTTFLFSASQPAMEKIDTDGDGIPDTFVIKGTPKPPKPPTFEVTFLDVGDGDSTLIITPQGKSILIDGGSKEASSYLISYLQERLKKKRIDILLLTHPHMNQVMGLNEVLENFEVGEVLDPGLPSKLSTYYKFLRLIEEKKIPSHTLTQGMTLDWDPLLKVEVLNPPQSGKTSSDLNNNSVVLKITYNQVSFLLPADIEKEKEEELVRLYGQGLKSTILKVPHKGSDTSSTLVFLQSIQPSFGLISIDKDNKYGYPSLEVVERYKRMGTTIWRTDAYNTRQLIEGRMETTHNSTVSILTDGVSYEVKPESPLAKVEGPVEKIAQPTIPPYSFPEITKEELAQKIPQEAIDVTPLNDTDYLPQVKKALQEARESIYVVMFAMRVGGGQANPVNSLVQELINARQRGVRVKVILERSKAAGGLGDANRQAYSLLKGAGIEVTLDSPEVKTHNKLLIIDRQITIVGAHNWTQDGLLSQDETSVLIRSRRVAQEFLRYFYEKRW